MKSEIYKENIEMELPKPITEEDKISLGEFEVEEDNLAQDKLDDKTETVLIRRIKQGDEKARSELIEKLQGLLFFLALKFFNRHTDHCIKHGFQDADELVSELNFYLIKRLDKWIETWQPKQKSFRGQVFYRLKMHLYDIGKPIVGPSIRIKRSRDRRGEEPIKVEYLDAGSDKDLARGGSKVKADDGWGNLTSGDISPEDWIIIKEWVEKLISIFDEYYRISRITKRTHQILKDLCEGELNQREISDKYDVSEPAVAQMKAKFIKFLRYKTQNSSVNLENIKDAFEVLKMYKAKFEEAKEK